MSESSRQVYEATSISFSKYHGLGNDFVLVDNRHSTFPLISQTQSAEICHRNLGIGADGVIFALKGMNDCHYTMVLYNADGGEAEMCGNGIRCLADFLVRLENRSIEYPFEYNIWTKAGRIVTKIIGDGTVAVNMGQPRLYPWSSAASLRPDESIPHFPLKLVLQEYHVIDISMGNPHAVIFVESISSIMDTFETEGSALSKHSMFPHGANAEFVEVLSPTHLSVEVWERGVGRTQACGTGACAALVAAILNGYVDRASCCTVSLPGGDLLIEWLRESDVVMMRGPAVGVYDGSVKVDLLLSAPENIVMGRME